jgi:hypothetical protein
MTTKATVHLAEAIIDWRQFDPNDELTVSFFLSGFVFPSSGTNAEVIKLAGFDFELSLIDDYALLTDKLKKTESNAVTAVLEVHGVRLRESAGEIIPHRAAG